MIAEPSSIIVKIIRDKTQSIVSAEMSITEAKKDLEWAYIQLRESKYKLTPADIVKIKTQIRNWKEYIKLEKKAITGLKKLI